MNLVSTQSQNLLKYEAELAQLRGKVVSLTAEMEEKDKLLLSRDMVLAEMRVQLNSNQQKIMEQPSSTVEQLAEERKVEEDLTEKLALKVTYHKFSTIHMKMISVVC
jgi:predicted  nucleic acid-binding Zn-ribbon protein